MTQLPFPSTIEAQPRNVTFLTTKTMVRKIQKNDGQTGSCAWTTQCLDKGGGGHACTGSADAHAVAHRCPLSANQDCSIQSAAQRAPHIWTRRSWACGDCFPSLVSACPRRRAEQRLIGGLQVVMVLVISGSLRSPTMSSQERRVAQMWCDSWRLSYGSWRSTDCGRR